MNNKWFNKITIIGFLTAVSVSTTTVSAISSAPTSPFGEAFVRHPQSPIFKVKGSNGKIYEVPYIRKWNNTGIGVNRYAHYAKLGLNALFRSDYGYATPYLPMPSGPYRLKNVETYSWDNLYESVRSRAPYPFRRNFFERRSVRLNTINCGYHATEGFGCYWNNDNLNPDGVIGHTNFTSGKRADGTFGKTGALGEVRFIGYSEKGNVIDNSYFVMDSRQEATPATYNYDRNVFTQTGKPTKKTFWDLDANWSLKKAALEDLIKQENLGHNANYWRNRLSLQTNPLTDAPVFFGTRDNGAGYQVLIVKPPAEATKNIGITAMKLYDDNGKLLAGMERKAGDDIVTIDFANLNINKRPKLEAGEHYKLKIFVKNDSEKATNITSQQIEVNGKTYTKCGRLGIGETCEFTIDYIAPDKGDQTVSIEAKLSDIYHETGDNLNPVDDYASIKIMVNKPPKGDVALNEIYLVEAKTNKVVQHPIQGVEYYLQFKGTYVGESMRGNELSFKVQADITTSVPQQNGTTAERVKTYYTNTIKTKLPESSSKNPLVFDFKTDTFVATSSTIKANATLIGPSGFKWNYNTNAGNDKLGAEWTAPINLTLTQVTLDPSGHPGGDYCGTLNLSYWVDFKLAYNITNRPLEVQKVEVAFYADGKYLKSDIINVYALQNKRQYTTQLNLENNCVKPGAQITVKLNPTHKIAESTLSDNNKTITWKTKYPDNYCENNNHYQLDWTQKYLNLATIENGYAVNVDQVKDKDWISLSNYEKVTITKIEMRSKLMADKKMGPNKDGWVDALNPGKDKIQIKAGYGFDIRVTVEYETNAYQNERTRLAHIPMSQLYTPLKPLELTDNLFIKLPGNGANLVSLTTNGLKLQRTERSVVANGVDKTTWTYTIQERLSPNGTNQMVDSLFIDENTKDGEYSINLYTLPIYGVPGKTLRKDPNDQFIEYDPICAKAQIKFEVKGSVYDDLNIGLIH